ncbi:MAG TPA: flavodoxin [Lactobacillaceae bacterium]
MQAHVVFATITGNNEAVADVIIDALQKRDVAVTKSEISQTEVEEFNDDNLAIVVPYTYDLGSLPDEGLDFYEDLQTIDLTGKIYGVAGSGDIFYEDDFAVAVPKFEAAFAKSGATRGAEGVLINLYPDADDVQKLTAFVDQLIATKKENA